MPRRDDEATPPFDEDLDGSRDGHLDEGLAHAWIDGALDAAERARVAAHVETCAACAALVAEARGFVAGAARILSALDAVPGGVRPGSEAGSRAGADPGGRAGAGADASHDDAHDPVLARDAQAIIELAHGRGAPNGVRPAPRRRLWTTPMRAAAALLLVAGGTSLVVGRGAWDRSRDEFQAAAPVAAARSEDRAARASSTVPSGPTRDSTRGDAAAAPRPSEPAVSGEASDVVAQRAPSSTGAAARAGEVPAPPGAPPATLRAAPAGTTPALQGAASGAAAKAVSPTASAELASANVARVDSAASSAADASPSERFAEPRAQMRARGAPAAAPAPVAPAAPPMPAPALEPPPMPQAAAQARVGGAGAAMRRETMASRDAGTVAGTVVAAGGAPVPNASVSVGTTQFAVTDAAGRFVVRDLPAGQVALRVRAVGYRAVVDTLEVAAGDTARPRVTMTAQSAALSAVVVTDANARAVEQRRLSRGGATEAASDSSSREAGRAAEAAEDAAALRDEAVARLAGCYDVDIDVPGDAAGADRDALARVPRRMVLGADASRGHARALAVRPAPSDGVAYWQPLGADAFRIVWLDGGTGATLRLSTSASEMRGTATPMIGDTPRTSRAVVARRAACPRGP